MACGAETRDKRVRHSPLSDQTRLGIFLYVFYLSTKMAFALNKTKRKLNQILDSISTISDTSLPLKRSKTNTSSTAVVEPPAKKARPLRPFSEYVPSTLQEIFEEDEEKRRASFVEQREKTKKPRPNFTPWDRGDFLERLKTFRHPHLWMTKPDKVNEVQWAKRGWRCVGKDRVACAGCGKEVVMSLEPDQPAIREDGEDATSDDGDWRQNAQEQLVEKYSEIILTGHDEGCLWRRRGCDATIQRLPLVHPSTTLEGIRIRYESFANLKAELPTSFRTPEKIDIKALGQSLSSTILPASSAETAESAEDSITIVSEINERALHFALFGWQAESERGLELATCHACFRRLGLWLFVPRPDPGSPSGEKEAVVNRLDLVQEHRSYCPWSNASVQSGGVKSSVLDDKAKELAGWEMVIRVVENLQYTRNLDDALTLERPLSASTNLDRATKDAKDRERFAKLKKLKKAFTIKKVKRVGKENVGRPSTAS